MKRYIGITIYMFFLLFSTIAEIGSSRNLSGTSAEHIIPFATFGPELLINTESSLKSAPSPIMYSMGIGIQWPADSFVSFQPRISFFTNYYLWDGERALPAEVENRTAIALSLMIDIPAVLSVAVNKNIFQGGLGLGFLARYGFLPAGVSSSDTGTTGSASGDVKEINDWFWSDFRYLYPELLVGWMYEVGDRVRTGLEARFYMPMESFVSGRGLDTAIISISAKIAF